MSKHELDAVLEALLKVDPGVSDINFTVGRKPQVEVHGELREVTLGGRLGVLTGDQTEKVARQLIQGEEALQKALEESGSCDCSYELPGGARFRVNIFTARGEQSVVLRALPSEIPSLRSLELPPVLGKIAPLRNGLVLVVGATGSGKSTTLAAVIDHINRKRAVHVVTLEDPIEFSHPHKKATVNQRELGRDFRSFADGLRAALRQAPKVILVGEMRDPETVEIALKAAETGHLVLSTLHTIDAGQTINRIIGMFDTEVQDLVRGRLAQVLRYVIGQRLLPKRGGGRVAALEIMGTSLRVRELVQNGESEDKSFYQVIADGKATSGWQTFDQHIVEHLKAGLIEEQAARAYASDRAVILREIDRLKAARGQETSSLGALEMDKVKGSEEWRETYPGKSRA